VGYHTLPVRFTREFVHPTFFYIKNPELYWFWYHICHYAPVGSANLIRSNFGARYVLGFNLPNWKEIYDRLSNEQGVREILLSDTWILFDLSPSINVKSVVIRE
jgi:hypothetical protein